MHASKLTVMTIAGAAIAAFASAASGSIINTTWTGPSGGVWGNALNWSAGTVPNNGADQFQVLINGGSPVNLTASAQISTLTLGSVGQLTTANATLFALSGGLLSNDGLLLVNSGGSQTDFRLDADTTFSTPLDGAVQFSNTQANRFYGSSSAFRLTNNDGHVIRGSVQFGINQLRLSNDGLIVADSSGNMTMDLTDGAGNFNTGVLRADGGTLTLQNTTLDNTNGVIEARNGSNFDLSGAFVANGVIDAQSGGHVRTSSSASLQNVTLNGGGYVGANATTTALLGSITANGPLTLSSGGSQTDLRIDTNPFTLTSGEIAFSNTQANRFYGLSSVNTLVVNAAGFIHGSAQFGVNQTRLSNDGLIVADSSGNMTMDLTDGAGNFNTGTLRADGGTLTLQNTTLDNTGGVIEARNGSNFDLNGASVANGLIDAQSGGHVRTVSTAWLQDVKLNGGGYVGANATTTILLGSIIADAPLTLSSGGSQTDLRIDTNPFTLTSGEIASSNTQANRFYGAFSVNTLVISPTGLVHGSMQLGVNQLRLDNDGLIVADSSGNMTMDLTDGAGNFNTGTLRADGGTLALANFTLDNTDGLIEGRNNSNVDLGNVYILGGEIGTQTGGRVRSTANPTLDGVVITGEYHGNNATTTSLRNVITDDGTMNIDSAGSQTDVRLDVSPTTLTGTGQMIFSNTQANRLFGLNNVFRLVNDAGHTIRGSFQLGVNQTAVTNDGSIIADASQGITIDVTDNQDFTNGPTGLLRASGGNIQIQPGPFLNSGAVTIDAGRTISRIGNFDQNGGVTTVNGTLAMNSGAVNITSGSLKGSGAVNGQVNNTGGKVEPGDSAGLLTINGPYTQSPFGTFKVEIGGLIPGAEHDVLNVVGAANLGGVIEIAVADDFVPVIGQEFTVLTSTNRVGQFTTLVAPSGFCVVYQGNNVIVRVQNTCSGDIVRSGTVNIDDLFAVINAWGACPGNCQPHCIADIAPPGGDCDVNVDDLFTVINAWGDCP